MLDFCPVCCLLSGLNALVVQRLAWREFPGGLVISEGSLQLGIEAAEMASLRVSAAQSGAGAGSDAQSSHIFNEEPISMKARMEWGGSSDTRVWAWGMV